MTDELTIRDFIYLDVERMKSIFSQSEEGLLESKSSEKGTDKKVVGGVGTSGLLETIGIKAEGKGEYVWLNKESETKTLHDHMYNYIEKKLKDNNSIIIIDEDLKEDWENGIISESIPDTAFILVKGKIMLDDYKRFEVIARNFNKISLSLDFLTNPYEVPKEKNKRKNKEESVIKRLKSQNSILEEKFIDSMLVIIETFFKNKLILKVIPFPENAFLRLIGTLNSKFLRDSIENIIFKYGTCPVSEWWVFGQISSIFPKDYEPILQNDRYTNLLENMTVLTQLIENLSSDDEKIKNEAIERLNDIDIDQNDLEILKRSGLEFAMENIFNALRGVDSTTSPKFPSITFTPIAIYRED
jgi:hypothetical protein